MYFLLFYMYVYSKYSIKFIFAFVFMACAETWPWTSGQRGQRFDSCDVARRRLSLRVIHHTWASSFCLVFRGCWVVHLASRGSGFESHRGSLCRSYKIYILNMPSNFLFVVFMACAETRPWTSGQQERRFDSCDVARRRLSLRVIHHTWASSFCLVFRGCWVVHLASRGSGFESHRGSLENSSQIISHT